MLCKDKLKLHLLPRYIKEDKVSQIAALPSNTVLLIYSAVTEQWSYGIDLQAIHLAVLAHYTAADEHG